VRVIGIGKLVASMDTDRRRRFFSGAIKSLTLDGKVYGVWRKRWVQSYELTDPLDTFISRRASACASKIKVSKRSPRDCVRFSSA